MRMLATVKEAQCLFRTRIMIWRGRAGVGRFQAWQTGLLSSPAVFREGCCQLSRDQSFGQAPHEGQDHKADQRQKRPCRRHRVLQAEPKAFNLLCPVIASQRATRGRPQGKGMTLEPVSAKTALLMSLHPAPQRCDSAWTYTLAPAKGRQSHKA